MSLLQNSFPFILFTAVNCNLHTSDDGSLFFIWIRFDSSIVNRFNQSFSSSMNSTLPPSLNASAANGTLDFVRIFLLIFYLVSLVYCVLNALILFAYK